jgi:hypothetical protein
MSKGFLIYEEMRKYFIIYEDAVSHILLCTRSLKTSLYIRKFFYLFFISVVFLSSFNLWPTPPPPLFIPLTRLCITLYSSRSPPPVLPLLVFLFYFPCPLYPLNHLSSPLSLLPLVVSLPCAFLSYSYISSFVCL